MATDLRLPRLKTSWCGSSLQAGTKIVAILHLVTAVGNGFVLGVGDYFEYERSINGTYMPSEDFLGEYVRQEFAMSRDVVMLAFSALCLYGAHKRTSLWLEPFIYMKLVSVLTHLIEIGALTVERIGGFREPIIFILLISLAIESYIATIVNSYKLQLENRED